MNCVVMYKYNNLFVGDDLNIPMRVSIYLSHISSDLKQEIYGTIQLYMTIQKWTRERTNVYCNRWNRDMVHHQNLFILHRVLRFFVVATFFVVVSVCLQLWINILLTYDFVSLNFLFIFICFCVSIFGCCRALIGFAFHLPHFSMFQVYTYFRT